VTTNIGPERLDKWLWCARLFRTRAEAAAFVEEHGVRLKRDERVRRVEKPAFALRGGDQIAFMRGQRLICVRVIAFSERRGAAVDAARLMENAASL